MGETPMLRSTATPGNWSGVIGMSLTQRTDKEVCARPAWTLCDSPWRRGRSTPGPLAAGVAVLLAVLVIARFGIPQASGEPSSGAQPSVTRASTAPATARAVASLKAELWDDLASEDEATAHQAVIAMVKAGNEGLAVLADRLAGLAADVSQEKIQSNIARLDDDKNAVRLQARGELAKLGRLAEPALAEAMGKASSAETRAALQSLLAACNWAMADSPDFRRLARIIWALELMDTGQAKIWLAKLTPALSPAPVRTSDAAPVRTLSSEVYAQAVQSRDRGDRLCAKYQAANRPGPCRNDEAFLQAALAFKEAIERFGGTEIDAYCRSRLAGLYQYVGRTDWTIRVTEEKARAFAGTQFETDAYISLALTYLQACHNPAKALAWYEKAQAPSQAAPAAGDQADPKADEVAKVHLAQLRAKSDAVMADGLGRCRRELAAREEADKTPWGDAVEGVQCRLRPTAAAFDVGKIPAFRADAQNTGGRNLWLTGRGGQWEVQVDGEWYVRPPSVDAISEWFGRDAQRYDLSVAMGTYWRAKEGGAALKLAPGRHVIRATLIAAPQDDAEKPVRATSGAVEVQVIQP
jgi:hypothetical protein